MRFQVPESLTTSLLLVVVLAQVVGANPPKADTHPSLPVITVKQPQTQPSENGSLAPVGASSIVPTSSAQATGQPPNQSSSQPIVQTPAQPMGVRQSLLNTSNALDTLLQER